MGALSDILIDIPNVKIYGGKFTLEIIKQDLEESGISNANLIEVKAHKKIDFGEESIFPIQVSHSLPDSYLYVLNTKDGGIVFTGNYIFDPSMMGPYSTDIGKLAYIGKQNVLCLLSESVFSEKTGHTSPNHRLTSFFKDVLSHNEDRLLFLVFPTHLYTIQEIFDAAANTHRKVVIMGKNLQNIISFSKKEGYLHFQDDILGDLSNIDDKDAILLIQDSKENPYASISKIINGYDILKVIVDLICFTYGRRKNEKEIQKN
jgi:ribonuclease J